MAKETENLDTMEQTDVDEEIEGVTYSVTYMTVEVKGVKPVAVETGEEYQKYITHLVE